MKIYLAAAWSRRAQIAQIADDLNLIPGITVNSRWLSEPVFAATDIDHLLFLRERALLDVGDVVSSDMLVRFTDDLSGPTVPSRLASGARMFEMGLAYAQKKPVVVVGGIQQIFDHLPGIVHLSCPAELRTFLRQHVSEVEKNV